MAKGRPPFVAENVITGFNEMRKLTKGIALTDTQMREYLRKCNCPSNIAFWNELKKTPLIIKTPKGYYRFADPDKPVYFGVLQKVYNDYHVKCVVKAKKQKDLQPLKENKERIRESVQFLESIGFIVLAPSKYYLSQ